MVIDCVAIRTSGLVPAAVVPAGLTPNTRNTTEGGTVIVVPAMMHSGGPLACGWISVQPPGATFALLIGVAPDSMTAALGARDRQMLPTRWSPMQNAPSGGASSMPASMSPPPASRVEQTKPSPDAWQVWPVGQLAVGGSQGTPPAIVGA